MKPCIKVGVIGRISSGDHMGCFLKVDDDSQNTGGFLILVSPSADFLEGSDNWVENMEKLEEYFVASAWNVEWLSGPNGDMR